MQTPNTLPDAELLATSQRLAELRSMVSELATRHGIVLDGLANCDPTFRTEAEQAFDSQRALYYETIPGLVVPELRDFTEVGVDFSKLEVAFGRYEQAGMQPELLVAPVNLSMEQWGQGYSKLRQRQEQQYPVPPEGQSDPLQGRRLKSPDNGDGLWVSDIVTTNWAMLNQQAVETTPGHNVTTPDGTVWKTLIVPTAPAAAGGLAVNTSHDLTTKNITQQINALQITEDMCTPNNVHMPLGTCLGMQAHRAFRDLPFVDNEDSPWTWAHGSFTVPGGTDQYNQPLPDVRRAPAVCWNAYYGQVDVGNGDVGSSRDRLGVRLSVWG